MIHWLAKLKFEPVEIYSADAHGNLGSGDTLDGIKREVELTIRILQLESQLAAKNFGKSNVTK